MRRHTFNPDHLRWGDPPLIWPTLSTGSLDKEDRRMKLALPLSAHSYFRLQVYSLTGMRAYFFRTLSYAEDQFRHSVSSTEQLLDSWLLHWSTAMVGLSGPQSIVHSNKSLFIYLYLFIFLSLSIYVYMYTYTHTHSLCNFCSSGTVVLNLWSVTPCGKGLEGPFIGIA